MKRFVTEKDLILVAYLSYLWYFNIRNLKVNLISPLSLGAKFIMTNHIAELSMLIQYSYFHFSS